MIFGLVWGVLAQKRHGSLARGKDIRDMQHHTKNLRIQTTYRFIILSPTLLLDSRLMLSPNDSSLSLSLLADSRRECECGFSVVGVPSFEA